MPILFDLDITRFIQSIDIPGLAQFLTFITWMGNYYQAVFSFIIVTGALFIYGYRKISLMLSLSTLGAVAISETLKIIVSRPRPDPSLINQVEIFTKHDSFPSGHVLFFMGFYGYLLFETTKLKKSHVKNLLKSILLGLIILVGISRIYLGSHWFSDVIGAYLIGIVWLYIIVLISNKLK